MVCAKFVWNWLSAWLWSRRFLNVGNLFLLFYYYLPLEKAMDLHLNQLKSPSHKYPMCKFGLKLAEWFSRRLFKSCKSMFSISPLSPLWKSRVPDLYNLKFPSPKGALYQVCLKLTKWFWRRRKKCERFTKRRWRRDRSEKLNWIFYSLEIRVSKLLCVFQNCRLIEIVTHQSHLLDLYLK